MVAGGYKRVVGHLSSTEILIKGGNSWVTVQALPRPLFEPASVSLADSVLLLGNLLYCQNYDLTITNTNPAHMIYLSLDVREVIKQALLLLGKLR